MSTQPLYLRKEISALPVILSPSTIYAVRRGVGFDLYVSDNTGTIAHKVNNTDDPSISPIFTYSAGLLTGITYSDGTIKILTYVSGQLTQIDRIKTGVTTRKMFIYANGALASITETVL